MCYETCKQCIEYGNKNNHNCLKCKDNYTFINDFENNKNCYIICDYYYYFDSNNEYKCTSNNSCPENYNKLIIEKKKCIDDCNKDNIYKYEYNNRCYENYNYINNNKSILDNFSIEKFFKGFYDFNNISLDSSFNDKIINNIKNNIINGNINLSNLIEGDKEDLLLKTNNILYQITSTENQKNNEYNNISTIDLGECENLLKNHYNLSENQSLIILKIEYYKNNSLIPIIGYEIFNPINNENLNLTYCKNTTINLNIPVILEEDNLYKYDPNNEYYTDECNPYTTEYGTDIILKDRHNEYNKNNMSICENNCKLKGYIIEDQKANCSCEIKNNQISISQINNDNNILKYNFQSKEESSNMNTMKCVNVLFTKEGIINNIANYLLMIIITIFLISGILFYKCGFNILEYCIQEIINLKEKKDKISINYIETIEINKNQKSLKKIYTKKKSKKIKNKKIFSQSTKNIDNSKSFSNLKKNKKNNDFKGLSKFENNLNYNDDELNSLSYKKAIEYDKRNYINYYISLLLLKHPIIFSFCPRKDYNSIIIKIDLFFLSFSIYYFTNALFFNESTIHKIYEEGGIYNLVQLFPFISYSFIISHTLTIIIKYFSLSQRNIYEIKNEKSFIKANDKTSDVKRCIIIKYICFYVLGSLVLIFIWYYLSSFGAVYQNTQIYLIKNTLISYGFSLIYPFIINLVPGIFRLYSLKDSTKKSECIYKISKIIQLI